jgi:hypothetical protein
MGHNKTPQKNKGIVYKRCLALQHYQLLLRKMIKIHLKSAFM